MIIRTLMLSAALSLSLTATAKVGDTVRGEGSDGSSITLTHLETFDKPWALEFLPDGRALVTEKEGTLWLTDANGRKISAIGNAPDVVARGQGGLGDIIVHPGFQQNGTVFISYVERDAEDDALSGAVVERATLTLNERGGNLTNREIVWRQAPFVEGNGHYGHRLAISPDNAEMGGGYLVIASGERQKFTPAQNMEMNLGKVIRINQDGSVPEDNPFAGQGGVTDQIWSLGHRNPLGVAFDADGVLWEQEMGPRHGDELNRIVRGENYGYPIVSNGDHYSGEEIPDHDTMPIYENPAEWWDPAISPAGLMIYRGGVHEDWEGDAFLGGLSSRALVRVEFQTSVVDNTGAANPEKTEVTAKEAARYEWGKRVRDVDQSPSGEIWVIEDREGGRLLRVEP